jgi:hypothetical protein
VFKAIARNKTDTDIQHKKTNVNSVQHQELLETHDNFFTVFAHINAAIIENINIQMEAETADMLDRRMM